MSSVIVIISLMVVQGKQPEAVTVPASKVSFTRTRAIFSLLEAFVPDHFGMVLLDIAKQASSSMKGAPRLKLSSGWIIALIRKPMRMGPLTVCRGTAHGRIDNSALSFGCDRDSHNRLQRCGAEFAPRAAPHD
ncbi:hypothetical protein [Rhizobium leguminosarum]|uniref:hypothetical protein n=1 Tax=Rhizobium leguminosarum TaxID=384 RepID=UPI0015FD6571|nr:hypothetical protein [Rhizobium leguminosarum]MBA9032936.1 hypothetical protein [Rhizobium leguminosarum]